MQLGDVIRRLTGTSRHVNVAKDVNTAVATNVGESGQTKVASSHRRTRIVQRDGETDVFETSEETTERRT